jgi:hypothetical protein
MIKSQLKSLKDKNNNININDHKWMLLAKGTVIGYHVMRWNAQLKACTFESELGYN